MKGSNFTIPAAKETSNGTDILAILATSDSIQGVLDKLIGFLRSRTTISRCGIFLYDERTQRILLRAAHGELEGLVGRLSFQLGEGLEGRALEERRPVYTEKASQEPDFLVIDDLPVSDHETFLAVPILRGQERIGVLSLQRPTGTPFELDEIGDLRTAASQIAMALESVKALLLVEGSLESTSSMPLAMSREYRFHGTAASKGCAIGKARILTRKRAVQLIEEHRTGVASAKIRHTLEEAVELTARQVRHYQISLGKRLPEAAAMLFESHLLMLKDDSFIGKIRERIAEGEVPTRAIATTAIEFMSFFDQSPHDFLREKARDIEDLTLRLLRNMSSELAADEEEVEEAHVLVTAELLPSDILHLSQNNVQGIVLVGGGSTAHVTLLVRSLGIPMIMTQARDLLRVPNGETIILDCVSQDIIVKPSEEVLKNYEERRRTADETARHSIAIKESTSTKDGQRVRLLANINLLSEVELAIQMKSEGIGLYRTEFPFLMRQALPTEVEQMRVYERLLDEMPDRPINFRTLDAGGDKVLAYFDKAREENPALGLRSTRLTLRYTYVFDQQLRAILRAIQSRQRHDVRLMFPMIGSIEELRAAMARVDACVGQLRKIPSKLPVINPPIGTMVELPALVPLAADIARETAFMSIGTNDFIQYMLAADRTNAQVSEYYTPHHPAVLQGLAQVVGSARRIGREISVCGEMGSDPRYVPFFIGVGVRIFSLEPSQLFKVQNLIGRISIAEAEEYARKLLATNSRDEIEAEIESMLKGIS